MPRVNRHRSNEVFSNANKEYWLAWFIAIVWNAITWFAIIKGGDNILKAFDESPIFYFFVLFPFIGLSTIYTAIRQTWAWYKFGKTPVTLEPFPAQIGGQCAGYMILPNTAKNVKQAELTLSCIHSYSYHSSNGDHSRREKTLWQDQIRLKPERYGRKQRLNFVFQPPADLPETSDQGDSYHLWRLKIHIPISGVDYERLFELPLEKVDKQVLAAQPLLSPQRSEQIAIPSAQKGLMPEIEKTSRGTQFYYGYGRSKGMGIGLLLVGFFIAGFIHLFFEGFGDFLPATQVLAIVYVDAIAGALALLGLFLLFNSLTVEVSLDGVYKRQRIFGFLWQEKVEAADIVSIAVEQSGSSTTGTTTRIWYSLKVFSRDGSHIEVGDSLEGQRYAEDIQQQMLAALGSTWQAAEADNPTGKKPKKPLPKWARWLGKLLSYSFWIAILYDLSDNLPEIKAFIQQFL